MSLSKKKRERAKELAEGKVQKRVRSRSFKEKTEEKFTNTLQQLKNTKKTDLQKALENINCITNRELLLTENEISKINKILSIVNKKANNIIKNIILPSDYTNISKSFEINSVIYLSKSQWLRNIEDWKPEGKSSITKCKSLINFLIGKYNISKFLYNIFNCLEECKRFFPLFCHIIQGGSIKGARKTGLLPANMTQKMDHLFLQSSGEFTITQAIRRAQTIAFGGNERLASVFSELHLLKDFKNDDFWSQVIQWFCNQGMFDYIKIGPIVDWFEHKRKEPNFVLKGRTITSVLTDVEVWHNRLNKGKSYPKVNFVPSGFLDWPNELIPESEESDWQIKELLFSGDLQKEGVAMKHCVSSYVNSIFEQRTSIWSLKILHERALTIEVLNKEKKIVQVRGKCNRKAYNFELHKIKQWARINSLTIGNYL